MGTCLYNFDHLTHKCQMWSEEEKDHPGIPEGCDEDGFCCADGDEDPSWCGTYQDSDPPEEEEECDGECPCLNPCDVGAMLPPHEVKWPSWAKTFVLEEK